jgi:hypothetical protein
MKKYRFRDDLYILGIAWGIILFVVYAVIRGH